MRLVFVALLLSCAQDAGHPPVPRLQMAPIYIPQNDNFQTPVVLDGSTSADEVDDPNMTRPLTFHWSFSEPYKIQDGDVDQAKMTVLFKGDRPVTVTLAVTDGDDHLTATATAQVGITLMP